MALMIGVQPVNNNGFTVSLVHTNAATPGSNKAITMTSTVLSMDSVKDILVSQVWQ
jgi:hypothetical protein